MSRLFAIDQSIDSIKTRQKITKMCEGLLPEKEPHVIAEAFIELGAKLCKRQPICTQCPLNSFCQAYQKGMMTQYPIRKKRYDNTVLDRAVVIIMSKDRVLMKKRDEKEIMAGLYEFPYYQLSKEDCLNIERITELARGDFGESLSFVQKLPSQKQVFTRYRVLLFPYIFRIEAFSSEQESYLLEDLPNLPSSSGHRRIKEVFLSEYRKFAEGIANYERK